MNNITNKQAKLMRQKSIERWIKSADMWIERLRRRFSAMGSPLTDNLPTPCSVAEHQLYDTGVVEWTRNPKNTQIKLPEGLETVAGAQAGISYTMGLRAAAHAEWQVLMDDLASSQQPSGDDDTVGTKVAGSQQDAPANKTESV